MTQCDYCPQEATRRLEYEGLSIYICEECLKEAQAKRATVQEARSDGR